MLSSSSLPPFATQSSPKHETGGTATPFRILLAEDDEMLSLFLIRLLREQGYLVEHVETGLDIESRLTEKVDLLMLDLNLPGRDGIDVLRHVRSRYAQLPVLVLTARSRTEGLLPALDTGADDCVSKPFSYLELLARVRVLLRRRAKAVSTESCCGDLVLLRDQMRVVRGTTEIGLTQREYALLEYLMRTPQIPVARAVLLQEIWGASPGSPTNIVDVYMKYVRDKVDLPGLPKLIRTVRGVGYAVSDGTPVMTL